MKIEILQPKGYCSGVVNAIHIARLARKSYPKKRVGVLGMLVHNSNVVEMLRKEGIETYFSENKTPEEMINVAPRDSVLIFTAHGHDEKLDEIAKKKSIIIYDAVCPKVKANFNRCQKEISHHHQVIFIGQSKHPETNAALSLDKNVILYDIYYGINYHKITDDSPYVVNQTTLNILDLKKIHESIKENIPNARIESEICDSTRIRQDSIINLESDVDLIIVVGDPNSSNANRLFEIAKQSHPDVLSIMVSDASEIDPSIKENKNHIVIASSASTPNEDIDMIYNLLSN